MLQSGKRGGKRREVRKGDVSTRMPISPVKVIEVIDFEFRNSKDVSQRFFLYVEHQGAPSA